jgi:transmembrane sensor
VQVGSGEVVAVGTVFDVYRRANDVVVTLIEGRVDVKANAQSLAVMAGEQVSFGAPGQAPLRSVADLARVSAWRSGKLEFRETPLAEAIAEANRYSHVRIELLDATLADARISGVFDAGRNDSLAVALGAYFGLRIQRVGENRILLTSGPP